MMMEQDDWWFWRRAHPRIFVARTGEDGEQSQWMRLLAELGGQKMDAIYQGVCKAIAKDTRVTLSMLIAYVEEHKPPPPAKALPPSNYQWKDESWQKVCDLCLNPAKFCQTRLHTNDPERVAKAAALAAEILSWYPEGTNKITVADRVMMNTEQVATLVARRFLSTPPSKRPTRLSEPSNVLPVSSEQE